MLVSFAPTNRDAFSSCTLVSLITFFLSLPRQSSQEFSTLTAPEPATSNFAPSTHCLGIARLVLGTLFACVRELRQFGLHVVLSIVQSFWFVTITRCRRFVVAMCCGKLSCLRTSACICQSLLVARMPPVTVFTCFPCFPAASLTKRMNWGPFLSLALHFLWALSRAVAKTSSTLLCLHLYLPSDRALRLDDRICSSVALLPHSCHSTHHSSLIFPVHMLVGVSNISCTELTAKRILHVSILQSSFHCILFARTDSDLIQLPCLFGPLPWWCGPILPLAVLRVGLVGAGVGLTLSWTCFGSYILALASHALLSRWCRFVKAVLLLS